MSEEPIEGRILDDREVKRMKWKEMESKVLNNIEDIQRQSYQQSRAENFYKQFDKQVIDRNSIWDTLRRGL